MPFGLLPVAGFPHPEAHEIICPSGRPTRAKLNLKKPRWNKAPRWSPQPLVQVFSDKPVIIQVRVMAFHPVDFRGLTRR